MMQRLLQFGFLIVFCGSALASQAQTIIHEELFNGSLGTWTAYNVIGPDQFWEADDFSGDQFAEMNGFDGGAQDNEDWLISPALDMDASENEILTFETAANFTGPALELLYSTDYDGSSDPSANGTWEDITMMASWSDLNYTVVQSGAIDLSGVSGNAVYLAFRYTSNTVDQAKLWQVDSVTVQGDVMVSTGEAFPDQITEPVVLDDHLQFDVLPGTGELAFYFADMAGRQLQVFPAAVRQGTVQLPISALPTGMYLLVVKSPEGRKGYQFVK